jgi:hypothetical protein
VVGNLGYEPQMIVRKGPATICISGQLAESLVAEKEKIACHD